MSNETKNKNENEADCQMFEYEKNHITCDFFSGVLPLTTMYDQQLNMALLNRLTIPAGPPHSAEYIESSGHHSFYHGFINGKHTDLTLHVSSEAQNKKYTFEIHKLAAMRSPRLNSILEQCNGRPVLELKTASPFLTYDGMRAALCHLYFDVRKVYCISINDIRPCAIPLIISLLSGASLLELNDLVSIAASCLYKHLNMLTIPTICEYLDKMDNHQLLSGIKLTVLTYFKENVINAIQNKFGVSIWDDRNCPSYKSLTCILSRFSFLDLKNLLEDHTFNIPSDVKRLDLAKSVILYRKMFMQNYFSHLSQFEERAYIELSHCVTSRLIFTKIKKTRPLNLPPSLAPAADHPQSTYKHQELSSSSPNNPIFPHPCLSASSMSVKSHDSYNPTEVIHPFGAYPSILFPTNLDLVSLHKYPSMNSSCNLTTTDAPTIPFDKNVPAVYNDATGDCVDGYTLLSDLHPSFP